MTIKHPATLVAMGLGGFALVRLIPLLFGVIETEAPLQWWASRSTGFLAYVALWLAMMLGLMISARGLDGVINRKVVLELHQQWTTAAVLATFAHIALVVTDEYVDVSWWGSVMPGSSSYMPGAVALGSIGMWGVGLLALSGWLQRRMNYTVWRVLHASAFGTFMISLVHGMVAGTDSSTAGAQILYAGTAALLMGAIVFRALYIPAKPSKAAKAAKPKAQPVLEAVPAAEAAADSRGAAA